MYVLREAWTRVRVYLYLFPGVPSTLPVGDARVTVVSEHGSGPHSARIHIGPTSVGDCTACVISTACDLSTVYWVHRILKSTQYTLRTHTVDMYVPGWRDTVTPNP